MKGHTSSRRTLFRLGVMRRKYPHYNRSMLSKSVVRVRIPPLLDITTYISLAVMTVLGTRGLHSLPSQLTALALCAVFGLLYRLGFRSGLYEKSPLLYFGSQLGVLVLLLMLRSTSVDAFNFLFLIVSIQAAFVLTRNAASLWIAAYYATVSAAALITGGTNGLFAIAFYLVTYLASGSFGRILQQAELAQQHNQELLAELKSTQQRLQELAVVEERNRLARDLHDSVKQQVFAISMQLGAARTALSESDPAYAAVAKAEQLARQAGGELTALIGELRPPGMERRDLSAALKKHVAQWSLQNEIEVDADIQDGLSVSVPVEQALFRVAQEALSNVARHSHASRAGVTLGIENGDVVLKIEDDGVGFEYDDAIKGVGLDSMRERLESVSGQLEVSSARKIGTCITARAGRS